MIKVSKALHCWYFLWRNHRSTVDSLHKGPVMRKTFLCHNVVIFRESIYPVHWDPNAAYPHAQVTSTRSKGYGRFISGSRGDWRTGWPAQWPRCSPGQRCDISPLQVSHKTPAHTNMYPTVCFVCRPRRGTIQCFVTRATPHSTHL